MMNAEESDMDELEVVPSHVFETQRVPSPVSALGGWATGAGSALFAVTKVLFLEQHYLMQYSFTEFESSLVLLYYSAQGFV